MRPIKMTAYEIAETIRNQPTMFQFRRRKNTSDAPRARSRSRRDRTGAVSLRRRDHVRIDDDVHEEPRDVHGGTEREHGTPEQRACKTFDGAGTKQEQNAGADDCCDVT